MINAVALFLLSCFFVHTPIASPPLAVNQHSFLQAETLFPANCCCCCCRHLDKNGNSEEATTKFQINIGAQQTLFPET
jgi:hypothetical protein